MRHLKQAGIGLTALCVATFGANAATERDNEVYFAIAGVQSFNFTQTAYAVTSGQPYGGVTSGVSKSSAQTQILVKAGRKGSTDVANWFKSQVGSGQTLVCDSTGTFPDELNFAVLGTLTIGVGGKTVTCDNVLVAQGHFTGANNWWMGGPNMKGVHIGPSGVTSQSCKVQGSILPAEVLFSPQTPCVNNFNISVN